MTDDPFSTEPSDPPVQSDDNDETDALPRQIGRFRIERILGQGGFGVVYLGHDEQLQRKVAIKVPKPQFVERAEDRELYLKEARTVAGLEHPNIVPVLEVGSTPEFPIYIVSKFIVGKDLAARLKKETPSTHQAVLWMIDLADALREAHRKGFVHRDVKPQNILVDQDERVYLVDFGLALADQDVGKRLPAGGTPAYMSPEQARGEGHRVDGRSDLFSLGILFYEMLCGRRPFQGNSQLELFEQITDLDPKPLRQWDESVPVELERICFKMLAKRKSERYSNANDLADDLKVFLTKSPLDSILDVAVKPPSPADTKRPNEDATPVATTPTSDSRTLKIVPKGLRSFDHRDADFFLELLPGARDRDGLPESVRFWKSRIEEREVDQTFVVGLVYGPSGCGKSSMMKAGLLPRLAPDVVVIYLEATPDDTEQTLLTLIRRKLDSKEAETTKSLVDLLHEIRRGRILPREKKLLIVIDQFEQWLFAHPNPAGESLLESLLQCDGSRVQAIVMVRDDFWMAATRFFRDLDIRLLEGSNSAAVDLFDLDHSERVLKAFGRAFGKLESDGKEDKQDRKQFIIEAVHGLSEQGKVISVRLALFAEMMKGRPWTPESLREVGGTTGVGATFLEETFSTSGAPPQYRYHQEAARSVLRALLPKTGTNINGHKRSTGELRSESLYDVRPREFDDLIRILDGELRLITPVDSTWMDNSEETRVGRKEIFSDSIPRARGEEESEEIPATNYRLTHDYLVPSLREWLTRKERETRRGRAELKLIERASAWNFKRETKQLPSLNEWLGIIWLTDRKHWTDSQRSMMQKARRVHLSNLGSALGLFLLALVGVLQFVAAQRWEGLKAQTHIAVNAAQNNLGSGVKFTHRDLEKLPPELVTPELEARFSSEDDPKKKLGLAFALARYEQVKADYLVGQIDAINAEDSSNFIVALDLNRELALSTLLSAAIGCDKSQLRRKAKLACVALYLKNGEIADKMCDIESKQDHEQRTFFVDEFPNWSGDFRRALDVATARNSASLRSAICLGLGQVSISRLSSEEKQAYGRIATNWFLGKSDPATHSASGWLLKKWEIPLPEITDAISIVPGRHWFVNSTGMTMLRMMPGRFYQTAESNDEGKRRDVEIKAEFWLADREVTVGQFNQFMADYWYPRIDKATKWEAPDFEVSPTSNHPVQKVSWYDAIKYCNWLSQQESLVPCYERTGEKETDFQGELKEYDAWRLVPGASGYRLPLDVEWEYACRVGTTSDFSMGSDVNQLVAYARFSSRTTVTCGDKLPNGWGLFDMHGNVLEWCNELTTSGRLFRGGSWSYDAKYCGAAFRGTSVPTNRTNEFGFRVALSPSVKSPAAKNNK